MKFINSIYTFQEPFRSLNTFHNTLPGVTRLRTQRYREATTENTSVSAGYAGVMLLK